MDGAEKHVRRLAIYVSQPSFKFASPLLRVSLFHLDTPSITVVVRTHHDPGTGQQYNYLPPHIAIDPLHADALTVRRKQLLDVLETIGDPSYLALVGEMLEHLDFARGFSILRHAMPCLQDLGGWDDALVIFCQKHGDLARGVADTLAECHRRENISRMRQHIDNPNHRFFLALLLNIENRADIHAVIAERFPDQAPIDTILGWAEGLIEFNDFGITLLDAVFPETCEVAIEDQAPLLLDALKHAMEGGAGLSEIYDALCDSCLLPLFFDTVAQ